MEEIKKELRDEIMTEIVLKHRENKKNGSNSEKVNLFSIWINHDITYSDFIDVILALDAQGYIEYEKADKNKEKIHTKTGEYVPQEFVIIKNDYKSFPEKLSDEKESEVKTNLKRPLQVQVLSTLIALLLSGASLHLLWQIIKWFLSHFHS